MQINLFAQNEQTNNIDEQTTLNKIEKKKTQNTKLKTQ